MECHVQHLATRAQRIATVVGATASTATRVAALDAGLRVRWPVVARLEAYLSAGAGVARVRQETAFSVSGATFAPETHGVQLGADLNGVVTKPIVVAGGGVIVPMTTRSFVDLGVRYSRLLARPSQIPQDQGINTVRVQAGVGIRF